MTNTPEVPEWVANLIERVRDYEQQYALFIDRGLPSEASDALQGKRATIRHLSRRLIDGVL